MIYLYQSIQDVREMNPLAWLLSMHRTVRQVELTPNLQFIGTIAVPAKLICSPVARKVTHAILHISTIKKSWGWGACSSTTTTNTKRGNMQRLIHGLVAIVITPVQLEWLCMSQSLGSSWLGRVST